MGYNKVSKKIYQGLIAMSGHFEIKDVVAIALLNSPSSYSKEEIKQLALLVLDEALKNNAIKSIGDGVYKSNMQKENKAENYLYNDDIIVDCCF